MTREVSNGEKSTSVFEGEGERRASSAEIRWYSPFVQNEFIRGLRNSHCGESRFLCDKGWEPQIGSERKKKSFISCSSEAEAVSEDQQRGWVERNAGETG